MYEGYFGFDFSKWPHPLAVWDDLKSEPSVLREMFSTKPSNKRGIDGMRRMVGRVDTDPIIKAANSSNFPFMVQMFDNGDNPFVSSLLDNKWKDNSAERFMLDTFTRVMRSGDGIKNERESTVYFTVPVSFSRLQMNKIEAIFIDSGLLAPVFIAQPAAVALMYAHKLNDTSSSARRSNKNILVFNMDFAYSDVAVVAVSSGKCQVKSMAGSAVGGIEMISNIISHILPDYKDICMKYLDGKKHYNALQNLGDQAEKMIRQLSKKEEYNMEIKLGDESEIKKVVKREEFEAVNEGLFQEIERLILQCMEDSQVKNIDNVVMVGVCCDIPRVRNVVSKTCKAKELRIGIDRLAAAVYGAVVAGAIHSTQIKMDFVPVTSLSIGIKDGDDNLFIIIPKNTPLPFEKEVCFSPLSHEQLEALVLVYEGDTGNVKNSNFLGFLKITEIPQVKGGNKLIKVSMKVDSVSRLNVKVTLVVPDSSYVFPSIESRMPQADYGFGWVPEELKRRYGSTMDLIAI